MDVPMLYDKKITCPMCGVSFTSKKLRSRAVRIEKVESDFYTVYKDPHYNPTLYEVNVCHECGFSFTEQFRLSFTSDIKERFKEIISEFWGKQHYSKERTYEEAVRIYKLAIISSKQTNQLSIVVAGLCLRLSWIYRYLEHNDEVRFQQYALHHYEESYLNGDFKDTSMSELKLLFLLGELSRKEGKKDTAIKYFSKIIQHKDRHLEMSIVEKAREQWYETRENRKNVSKS